MTKTSATANIVVNHHQVNIIIAAVFLIQTNVSLTNVSLSDIKATAVTTINIIICTALLAVSRSRHLTVCDGVSECASAIVQDIRCFGYRNLTLETSSPASQSSAVASPGPAKCCARSTPPLCHAVI